MGYLRLGVSPPKVDSFLVGKEGSPFEGEETIQLEGVYSVVFAVDSLDFMSPTALSVPPSNHKDRIIKSNDPVASSSFEF